MECSDLLLLLCVVCCADPTSVPGVCGLLNMGNTCYMNAGLQCIRGIPEIAQYYLGERGSMTLCDECLLHCSLYIQVLPSSHAVRNSHLTLTRSESAHKALTPHSAAAGVVSPAHSSPAIACPAHTSPLSGLCRATSAAVCPLYCTSCGVDSSQLCTRRPSRPRSECCTRSSVTIGR